jgi:aspartyl-tRNA(Asn)/glutamyl-tRNA(Gln) amidotransferase subunit A
MPSAELHNLTLTEAARLISVRKLSPVEYTESLLARTEALEPQLSAFITRTPDIAIAAARSAEAEIMHGNLRGPLHGIPSPSRISTTRPAS